MTRKNQSALLEVHDQNVALHESKPTIMLLKWSFTHSERITELEKQLPFYVMFGFIKDSESLLSTTMFTGPDTITESNDPFPGEDTSSTPALTEPIIKDLIEPAPYSSQYITVEVLVL